MSLFHCCRPSHPSHAEVVKMAALWRVAEAGAAVLAGGLLRRMFACETRKPKKRTWSELCDGSFRQRQRRSLSHDADAASHRCRPRRPWDRDPLGMAMAAATGRIRIRSSQMSHHPCWTANHRRQLLHTDWGSLPRERTKQQPAAAFLGLESIFDSSILPTSLAHVSSPSPTVAAVRVGSWCAWSKRQLSRLRRNDPVGKEHGPPGRSRPCHPRLQREHRRCAETIRRLARPRALFPMAIRPNSKLVDVALPFFAASVRESKSAVRRFTLRSRMLALKSMTIYKRE